MRDAARIKREPFVLDLHGAFIRRTDEWCNLANANCTGVNFRGANLRGTILKGTTLRGADFTDAKNLTAEQLADAVIDDATVLPSHSPTQAPVAVGQRGGVDVRASRA